ncbi:MAG: hypothetical protein JKX84_10865, partial [Flavobacteriales bacterium]|nr:hypothetical protein [Flavobacteriales bacterium]
MKRKLSTLLLTIFMVQPLFSQSISDISPSTAYQNQLLQVTVSGTSLDFTGGTGTTMWIKKGNYVRTGSTNTVEPTAINANLNIPISAPTGLYDVHVGVNGVSMVQLTNGFEVLPVLPPPTLILPTNGAVLTSNPVTLQWTSVAGAAYYEYRFIGNGNISGTPSVTEAQVPLLNDQYTLRLRTYNAAGIYGSWSSDFTFSVETVVSLTSIAPTSGYQGQILPITITGTNVTFDQGSSTLVDFDLTNGPTTIPTTVSADTSFNGTDFDFVGTGDLSIPLAAPTGTYDLNLNDPFNADFTLPQSFTVLPALPATEAPDLITPIQGEELTVSSVQFDWTEPAGAIGYQIQIHPNADFISPLIDVGNLTESSFDTDLYQSNYYWRVRARNLSNVYGPWSSVRDFQIEDVTYLTDMEPDQGYAGQPGLSVSFSGVNLPFQSGTSTVSDLWLEKNSFQFPFNPGYINAATGGFGELNIPVSAPVGYYDLFYDFPPLETYSLENAFYVTEGNEYTGQIYIDVNQDQIFNSGDVPYPYATVNVSPNPLYSISQNDGVYVGHVPSGDYTLSLEADYYTVQPSQHSVSFTGTGGVADGKDFAL